MASRFVTAVLTYTCLTVVASAAATADTLTRSIQVGNGPFYSVANADGTRLYVANVLDASISVINTTTDSVVATVPLQRLPGTLDAIHLALTPNGTMLYAVDENLGSSGTVNVIATATNQVIQIVPVQQRPTHIVARPDGLEVYVVNGWGFSVSIIRTSDHQVTTIPIPGYYPSKVAFSADSRRAYVTRYGAGYPGGVTVLNTVTRTVVGTLNDSGGGSSPLPSADGSMLYVTHYNPDPNKVVLSIIATDTDADTYQLTHALTGPAGSAWLALAPDSLRGYLVSTFLPVAQIFDASISGFAGSIGLPFPGAHPVWDASSDRILIPHRANDVVSVLDSSSGVVIETVATGDGPAYISLAQGKAYVANYGDGTVTVIAWPLYRICPLYDESKAVRSGSTVPLRIQVCDERGANLSSPDLLVTATGITRTADDAPGVLLDSGNANPDYNFRYAASGPAGTNYIFNLSTSGLLIGTYRVALRVGNDPVPYFLSFQVK